MKIAVIGGGGREHALIQKLREGKGNHGIIAIPGNGGIASVATCIPLNPIDITAIAEYCAGNKVDYVIVAPDDPLALGMVDALAAKGIPAFGPTAAASRIESSKVFAKELMRDHNIPTARYEVFTDAEEAHSYLRSGIDYPVVIKADGLALGKGVLICLDEQEAVVAVRNIMKERIFGNSGSRIIVEEFLTGPEISALAFCDGETLVPMVTSMDHKRALEGDQGPNTGGMGAIAPNPFYTKELEKLCMDLIFLPTLRAMKEKGAPFKGCLYFGLMLTPTGPKVIEYNCRFGDPETQAILPLLEGNLLEIMQACTEGRLTKEMVKLREDSSCCVVLASGGYPGSYKKGLPITGLETLTNQADIHVYHAGTQLENGTLVTSGGRVLGITAVAPTLQQAVNRAYEAAGQVHFDGVYCRHDIGKKALELQSIVSVN